VSFAKLDSGLLDSTLWEDMNATRLFITALLMARPKEVREPMEQYKVTSLEKTGFIVQPGWYGFVEASGPGLGKRSELSVDDAATALEKLGSPEVNSRTPDYDGRRLVRVSGGFIVLNYQKYRDKDSTIAARQARFRMRNRISNAVIVTPVTQEEEEAEEEAEEQKKTTRRVTTAPLVFDPPEELKEHAAKILAYLRFRKETKHLVTPTGLVSLMGKLVKMKANGVDINLAMDESMANGWQGVFPPKNVAPPNLQPHPIYGVTTEMCEQAMRDAGMDPK